MNMLLTDDAMGYFRPNGAGLPKKGKGAPKKRAPKAPPAAPERCAQGLGATPVADAVTPTAVAQLSAPPAPPPPKLVRPVFTMPDASSNVWDEVLTEVVTTARPPSVPVKVRFADSSELPHWHDMPKEVQGLPVHGSEPSQAAAVAATSKVGALAPAATEPSTPQHFLAKEDADLLTDWFQDMERPYLQAAAKHAGANLEHHVVLALPVERMGPLSRRVAMVARKVQRDDGSLRGYEYPKAGHEQMLAVLPWTHHMPTDELNDAVRRLTGLANRLRRFEQ